MSAVAEGHKSPAWAEISGGLRALRAAVRVRLEDELLTLRCQDRLALIRLLDSHDEPLEPEQRDVLNAELEVVNRRIAAILGHLGHEAPSPETAAHPEGAVFLDLGEGSRLRLLTELPVPGVADVITLDSPLGVALTASPAGNLVSYPTPRGVRHARVSRRQTT